MRRWAVLGAPLAAVVAMWVSGAATWAGPQIEDREPGPLAECLLHRPAPKVAARVQGCLSSSDSADAVRTPSLAAGSSDACLLPTLDDRCEAWVQRFDAQSESGMAIASAFVDGSPRVFVTGGSGRVAPVDNGTMTDDSNEVDVLTVAYDGAGTELWAATYGEVGVNDTAWDVAVAPGGEAIYVTGQQDTGAAGSDYVTVAYDAVTGGELWAARYEGPEGVRDAAAAVAVAPDGEEVYVTGSSGELVAGRVAGDYATVAYDADTGKELWVARYNGPEGRDDRAADIVASEDAVFVTGSAGAGGSDQYNYATVAYDTREDHEGERLWSSTYSGGAWDEPLAMALAPSGATVYVTGARGSWTGWATLAYDAATGKRRWVAGFTGFGGNPGSGAIALAPSPGGDRLYVTGATHEGLYKTGIGTAAYDTQTGSMLWSTTYSTPGFLAEAGLGIGVTDAGVYASGFSWNVYTQADYVALSYDPASGHQRWVARYNSDPRGCDIDYHSSMAVSPEAGKLFLTGTFDRPSGIYGCGNFGVFDGDVGTVAYDL